MQQHQNPATQPPGTYTLQDMDLLRNFITKTASSLSEDPAVGQVIATTGVDIAMKNEFVLHMILCLSALHRCATEPSIRTSEVLSLLEASSHHQNLAMALFRERVTNVTTENAEAVFVFTSLTSLSLYSSQNDRLRLQHGLEVGEKTRLAHSGWLRTLRGTTSLLGGGGDLSQWLGENSPLLILIPYRGTWNPPISEDNEWAQAAAVAFQKLSDKCANTSDPREAVFHEASQHLIPCLAHITAAQAALSAGRTTINDEFNNQGRISARPTSYCLTWIFRISADFLNALDDAEPAALVVLAHFGVLLHSLKPDWCLDGLGKAVIEACDEVLQAVAELGWREWMVWPQQTIRGIDHERALQGAVTTS